VEAKLKPVVLVVDDMPENIDLLVGLLKKNYSIKAAVSGELALKITRSANPPDLILLDVVMPGMDGFEVCKRIKENPATASIPLIFLSGESGNEVRKRGEELGAFGYLTKPVNPESLSSTISAALNQ